MDNKVIESLERIATALEIIAEQSRKNGLDVKIIAEGVCAIETILTSDAK